MKSRPETLNAWRVVLGSAAILAVLALVVFVRVRLLSMPLERDEGEYAYAGQLMLEGIPPYQLAFNMKLPGTYAAYAGFLALFGETPKAIHLGFLFVNLGCLVLLFLIARRLTGWLGAVVACVSYGLMAMSPGVLGLAGHATHLVTFFALAGLLLLLRARDSRREAVLFWSGTCFGLSFVCKQPGLYFGMFGFLLVARDTLRTPPLLWKRLLSRCTIFSIGLALPLALTCLIFWQLGNFRQFWFWTFTYAQVHAGIIPLKVAWDELVDFCRQCGWIKLFWLPAAAGLACLLVKPNRSQRKFLLLTLLALSFITFAAAFYFSRHYFIVMLPVVSLLSAVAVTEAAEGLKNSASEAMRLMPAGVFALLCAGFVFTQREIWFQLSPDEAVRSIYGQNPFVESVAIARYIREHSDPDAKIAVIGSEPQIYFYAHRHSASGFIYMYDLVQTHRFASQFQREMIADIQAQKPEYLVMVTINTSWLDWPGADTTLADWAGEYASQNYSRVGLVLTYPHFRSDYVWDNAPLPPAREKGYLIGVYKRKSSL